MGNLTSVTCATSPSISLSYDADNRLTNMVDGIATTAYSYDQVGQLLSEGGLWLDDTVNNTYQNRLRNYLPSSSSDLLTNEVRFIYDENLVVEERNADNIPLVSYTRGNDLSGSLQGAGGISGLLARTTYGQELPGAPTSEFYHADGNGNITALMYPNQQLAAKYLYDPFGNMLAMSGPLGNFNKYRFSSKEWNDNSGLYYYGYRFYDAELQRWPNRDPLNAVVGEEARFELLQNYGFDDDYAQTVAAIPADLNDYIFVRNRPVTDYDLLGLCDPLPDSGPGDFHSNIVGHNFFHGPTGTLTFHVCCPAAEQYLASYGISALESPPATTGHGHNFPGDYTTVTPPSGSGPCYTVVISVTTTASVDWWLNPWANFINEIRVVGKCCACSSGAPTRSDPPTLPPPHRHGSGLLA